MKLENDYEVVISGVGGLFPKCINIEEFKQRLLNNEFLMGSRWKEGERDVTNALGTAPLVESFDASYFGIHRTQCNFMDPMQRLVLERTYEAVIDAGINPTDIKGKRIGVYAASCVGENDNIFYESILSGFGVMGHSRAMMCNRVSYWLNLSGPSCAYDSNWLGGVEALKAAYEVVKTGQCMSALVFATNLALNSEVSWVYNDMGLLSPDGKTKPFDVNANGYGRSDGIVALYIQRACDAKRSYATILGIDSSFYGLRDGPFREVNLNDMVEYVTKFYNNCNVDPRDVEFVECYGCGISNTDKVELDALDKVYCKNREKPLLVGSVKSNSGHSEASSALVSLVKVLVAMESGIIPATLNYNSPNPKIDSLIKGRIEVVTKNREWCVNLAAINGFGVGSTYGHILLKANPKSKMEAADNIPRLVNISTRTEEGIQAIINSLKSETKIDPEYACLIQDTFKTNITGHLYRGYTISDGTEEAKTEFQYYPGNKRPVWFVYSGMGSQWCKMAVDLMELPLFAETIHKCHKILEPKGIDLLEIVTGDDEAMFENVLHSFVGIAAVQIALTNILHAIGIVPDGIIGHSVGELGCAYADGCLSAEQMILCAYSRGKASLDADLITGMMAAVGKSYSQIKDQCPPSIEVACHNGPDSSTISGPREDMEIFVQKLQDEGTFARLVNVSNIAYHSKYIKPAAPLLLEYLQDVIPKPLLRSSKWVSTSIPEDKWDTDLAKTSSAEYHTNNLLSSVLFEEGSRHIPKEAIIIEIAPHGLLQAILKRSIKGNITNIPLTNKTAKNQLNFLLAALGKLYLVGLDINTSALYPKIEYPVGRGTKSLTPLIHWEHGESWKCGVENKLNHLAGVRNLDMSLKNEKFRELVDHQLQNTVVIPSSIYLAALCDILGSLKSAKINEMIIENVKLKNIVRVPKRGNVLVYIMAQKGSGAFEISSGNELIGTGRVRSPEGEKMFAEVSDIEISENSLELTGNDVYSEFHHRHHQYGELYKSIKTLHLAKEGSVGIVMWNNNWYNFVEAMLQQYLFNKGERGQNTLTVSAIRRIAIEFPTLPLEPSELQVSYNYSTGIISTPGIQISGVIATSLDVLGIVHRPISYKVIEFTPLSNNRYTRIESGLNLGLQITLDNFEERTNNAMIFEIQTENSNLENNIKNVFRKHPLLSPSFSTVDNSEDILISHTQPVYVIINNIPTEECIQLVAASHTFLLGHTDSRVLSNPEITQVAEFSVDGISFSLIRKSTNITPVIVPIESDTLTVKDFSSKNLSWVSQFKSALRSKKVQRIYLVSAVVPSEGIINFFNKAKALPDMHYVRFVFILDRNVPEFSFNECYYESIFKNDLFLSIVKDGTIATCISAPTEFENDVAHTIQTTSNIIENTRIDYLGINVKDETLTLKGDHKSELGNIDYSGVSSSGHRIMGLASLELQFSKLVPDPILWWVLPHRWNLEDAATAPHAYILAYYVLLVRGRVRPGEIVLVHGGCSPYGLAAISIATKLGCTIFTTVTSEKQKTFLKRKFMCMTDYNIFDAYNTSFEPKLLLATGGIGAHMILNCLSGSMLHATLRCVANFGRVVQIGKLDIEENTDIGMRVFLKNVALGSVTIENIFNASIEVKQKIHKLITEGLKTYTVRPIFRNVVEHQDIRSVLSLLKQPDRIGKIVVKVSNNLAFSELNINRPSQFICDPKCSYLINGGTSEMWIDIVEWLLFRGARKVIVSSDSKPQTAHINRRLKLYQNYYNLEIIHTLTKAQTSETAAELLSEAYSLGPIGAVFVLSTKDARSKHADTKAVQYLDSALKTAAPKALLINFLNSAAGVCQIRSDAGFPTHNIQWESHLEFADILYAMDDILRFKVKDVLINDEQCYETVEESAQSFYKKLSLLFPSSVDKLKQEVANAPSKPDFVSLASLCTRTPREVSPIFVIPGLFSKSAIKELASKLFYPVFCADFPINMSSLKSVAEILVNRMKEIYPRGPYNVIGVSYGGILAIEIVKILERDNHKTLLQLIDGAPDTIQGILKHLGAGYSREVGLLCRILNLTNPQVVKGLTSQSHWEARLKFAFQHYECSAEDKVLLSEILTTLKKYVDEIADFRPSENMVAGQICLLRPTGANRYDDCGLPKYCEQEPLVRLIDGNHSSILKEKVTVTFINNKVIC